MRTAIAGLCLLAIVSSAGTSARAGNKLSGSLLFVDSGLNLSAGSSCFAVCLGDVDGDGDPDAFVTQFHTASRLWLNDGGGIYLPSGATFDGTSAHGSALEDLDGDGDIDVRVVTYGVPNAIWLNDGTGHFSFGRTLASGVSGAVALGDLDGDRDLDI